MKKNGVYFVKIVKEEYIVKAANDKFIYQGNEEGYEALVQKYPQSVFIIDDIPTPEETLSDLAK